MPSNSLSAVQSDVSTSSKCISFIRLLFLRLYNLTRFIFCLEDQSFKSWNQISHFGNVLERGRQMQTCYADIDFKDCGSQLKHIGLFNTSFYESYIGISVPLFIVEFHVTAWLLEILVNIVIAVRSHNLAHF